MLTWFIANLGTIAISALLLLAAGLAMRSVLRARKEGGACSCGGRCDTCNAGCESRR